MDVLLLSGGLLAAAVFVFSFSGRPGSEFEYDPPGIDTATVSSPATVSGGDDSLTAQMTAELAKVDPRKDNWQTEAFHEAAQTQLKKLGKLLAHPEQLNSDSLAPYTVAGCKATPLRPPDLAQVFSDLTVRVLRPFAVPGKLAAAYAELGQFDEAVDVARSALSLLPDNDSGAIARRLREELKLFESQKPYRQRLREKYVGEAQLVQPRRVTFLISKEARFH